MPSKNAKFANCGCGHKHFVSPQRLFVQMKRSTIPPDGWTLESFRSRAGIALLRDQINVQRMAKAKGARLLSKPLAALLRGQVTQVIENFRRNHLRITGQEARSTFVRGTKASVTVSQHADLWAEAIELAFKDVDAKVVATVRPPLQSVADDVLEKTTSLLTGARPTAAAARAMKTQVNEIATKVTSINDTTRASLSKLIAKAVDDGKSPFEVMELVREKIPQLATNRVPTIVRTEMGNAADRATILSMKESNVVTHVSVTGCEAIEPNGPSWNGIPTCNIRNVPIESASSLIFHPNHTGSIVSTGFRKVDGGVPKIDPKPGAEGIGTWEDRGKPVPALVRDKPPTPPAAPPRSPDAPPTPPAPAVPTVPAPKPIPLPPPDLSDLLPPAPPLAPAAPKLPPLPPAAAVKPKPAPVLPSARTSAFPSSPAEVLEEMQDLSSAGGSTGARIVRSKITGKQFILKKGLKGDAADRLAEEKLADDLYAVMGVNVPVTKLYALPDGSKIKLAEFIEGDTKTLGQYLSSATADERAAMIAEAQKGFHVDAWLGNWDVVGANLDNMLVVDGKLWRVDSGGALSWRAQGERKAGGLSRSINELWSMRNKRNNWETNATGLNRKAHEVFGSLNPYALAKAIDKANIDGDFAKALALIEDGMSDSVSDSVANELLDRLKVRSQKMVDYAVRGRRWEKALMRDTYFDETSYDMHGFDSEGLLDRLPKRLKPKSSQDFVTLVDEKGKTWDHLRGEDSIPAQWVDALAKKLGMPSERVDQVIQMWASSHAGSSWGLTAGRFKAWVSSRTMNDTVTPDDFFWGRVNKVKMTPEVVGEWVKDYADHLSVSVDQLDAILTGWHALTQTLLEKVAMPNVDATRGLIRVLRTEADSVLNVYGLKSSTNPSGKDNAEYLRGANESASLVWAIEVNGMDVLDHAAPISRVQSLYVFGRGKRKGEGFFSWDSENEVSLNLLGIKAKFHTSVKNYADLKRIPKPSRNADDWKLDLPKLD